MAPAPDRLRADHPAGALEPGLRRVRASRVRALQARPHNPDFSTSGLEAVVAEYYAATGKKEGLTEQDVESSKARAIVRDIERSIVHYGDTTLFIADQMRKEGPGYASAVAMEEVTLLDFNRNRGPQPKLVALYPPEGTFYSDNPFIILDGDWVRPAQRQGAERFQEFLAEEITPELAARSGFRPADLEEEAVAPVSKENGADPSRARSTASGGPGARTASRPTCCSSSTRRDRWPRRTGSFVPSRGSKRSSRRSASRTASG
jgi:Ca-activated chloride channel homolog